MKFKIHGTADKVDGEITQFVEILGKKSILEMINQRIDASLKDAYSEINSLNANLSKQEEETFVLKNKIEALKHE